MKVLIFMGTILTSCFALQLSLDGIEDLFKKYVRNEVTPSESQQLQDVIDILHRPEHISRLLPGTGSQVRSTLDCFVCRTAMAVVFEAVKSGQSDDKVTDMVVNLCTSLNLVSFPVCNGAVKMNVPIIAYIVRTTPEATAREFCGLVLDAENGPNACSIGESRFEWQVELPDPAPVINVPTIDPKPLKVAVITDAHIDPLYEAFGVAECDEPVCCRKGQTPVQNYEYKSNVEESLIEQSIKKDDGEIMLDLDIAPKIRELRRSSQTRFLSTRSAEPAGFWGDYRNCDSPIWAFDNVVDTITETHKDIDVVYYIGDSVDHGVWATSYELVEAMNHHVIDKIRSSFGDQVPVLPVVGNHESQPTNQFAPSYVTGENLNTTWLYEALIKKWGFYLDEEAIASVRQRGAFSMVIRPGLRVLTLNTILPYRYNWWLLFDPLDSKRHLDWMIEELYKAEQAGEKVHILSHIPPGNTNIIQVWTREYNRIINRFSATITAEFNGHIHSDEFKIFYSLEDGSPINVAWGGGSATTYTYYNSNYKIAEFHPVSYKPESITSYVYNLTEANLTPYEPPRWFQLYDMQHTFSLADLSASSMNDLVYRMVTTDRHLLDKYNSFYSKGNDDSWEHCDNECKIEYLCNTVVTVLWERARCEELIKLFYEN